MFAPPPLPADVDRAKHLTVNAEVVAAVHGFLRCVRHRSHDAAFYMHGSCGRCAARKGDPSLEEVLARGAR